MGWKEYIWETVWMKNWQDFGLDRRGIFGKESGVKNKFWCYWSGRLDRQVILLIVMGKLRKYWDEKVDEFTFWKFNIP